MAGISHYSRKVIFDGVDIANKVCSLELLSLPGSIDSVKIGFRIKKAEIKEDGTIVIETVRYQPEAEA